MRLRAWQPPAPCQNWQLLAQKLPPPQVATEGVGGWVLELGHWISPWVAL